MRQLVCYIAGSVPESVLLIPGSTLCFLWSDGNFWPQGWRQKASGRTGLSLAARVKAPHPLSDSVARLGRMSDTISPVDQLTKQLIQSCDWVWKWIGAFKDPQIVENWEQGVEKCCLLPQGTVDICFSRHLDADLQKKQQQQEQQQQTSHPLQLDLGNVLLA